MQMFWQQRQPAQLGLENWEAWVQSPAGARDIFPKLPERLLCPILSAIWLVPEDLCLMEKNKPGLISSSLITTNLLLNSLALPKPKTFLNGELHVSADSRFHSLNVSVSVSNYKCTVPFLFTCNRHSFRRTAFSPLGQAPPPSRTIPDNTRKHKEEKMQTYKLLRILTE